MAIVRRASFPYQMWKFISKKKKWWLLPIVVLLLLAAILIIFAQSSALSPFIYAMF